MSRITAIALAAAVTGCASITQGTTQSVAFSIVPGHAQCNVMRDGEGEIGSLSRGQRILSISKDKDDLIVSCTAAGYAPKVQRVRSSTQTEGVMSVLFIDLGITDMVTGAMWAYPAAVNIAMDKLEDGEAAATRPAPAVISQRGTMPVVLEPTDNPSIGLAAPAPKQEVGESSYQVERMPEVRACAAQPRVVLAGKGPGNEVYSVACANGNLMMIRCEFRTCRVLR